MKKQIVVVVSGWVFIGNVTKNAQGDLVIKSAINLRKWGTTRGLGEIALIGMQKDAQYDDYGIVRVPQSQVIFTIDCVV